MLFGRYGEIQCVSPCVFLETSLFSQSKQKLPSGPLWFSWWTVATLGNFSVPHICWLSRRELETYMLQLFLFFFNTPLVYRLICNVVSDCSRTTALVFVYRYVDLKVLMCGFLSPFVLQAHPNLFPPSSLYVCIACVCIWGWLVQSRSGYSGQMSSCQYYTQVSFFFTGSHTSMHVRMKDTAATLLHEAHC